MADLSQLHPKVKELAEKHIAKCKEAGIDLLVYCTYRSIKEQDALYAQGRTKPGKKITNARGGQSMHNFRVAYDCGPVVNGKIDWNNTKLFVKIGEIGELLGLEWGGCFKSIVDLPHFQYTQGLSLKDFQAGKTIK